MIVYGRLKFPHFISPLSGQWIKKQNDKEILTGREKGNTQSWLQTLHVYKSSSFFLRLFPPPLTFSFQETPTGTEMSEAVMSEEQPMPTAMTLNTAATSNTAASTQQQEEVMRLRGGGNTFADCLAYLLLRCY